jgi:hypothetical protein
MPRDGAIIFRDIAGKLDVLRITCDKCERSGQYRVDRLIEQNGIDAKLFDRSQRPIVRAMFDSVAGEVAAIKRGSTIQPISNEELKANARRAYDERAPYSRTSSMLCSPALLKSSRMNEGGFEPDGSISALHGRGSSFGQAARFR